MGHGDFKAQISLSCFTFAGANEEVAVRGDSTESQIHHRPGVTGAGERCLSHRHGSFGQTAGSRQGLARSVSGGGRRLLAVCHLAASS